jgi:hypothetical protein
MIFRVDKSNGNFTQVSNDMVLDERLSWKAKGVLLYMLSKPDDWQFYLHEILKHGRDKVDGVRSAIIELENNGYIERKRKRDSQGKLRQYEYNIRESNHIGFSCLGFSNTSNTDNTNTNIYDSENRHVQLFLEVRSRFLKDKHRRTQSTISSEIEEFENEELLYVRFFQENHLKPERCNIDYFNTVLENRYMKGY